MGFEPSQELNVEVVNDFVMCMKSALDEMRGALKKAKDNILRATAQSKCKVCMR
jgi:hypothetical protein